MKRFNITFTCTEDKLATLISLLSGECLNLTVSETHIERKPRSIPQTSPAKVDRIGWVAKYAGKLLSAMEPGRPYTIHDKSLHDLFPDKKPGTIGSMLAALVRAKKLSRVAPGTYVKS